MRWVRTLARGSAGISILMDRSAVEGEPAFVGELDAGLFLQAIGPLRDQLQLLCEGPPRLFRAPRSRTLRAKRHRISGP